MRRRWGQQPRNSLAGGRYQPQYGPPIIDAITGTCGLHEGQRALLWRALCQAQWSQVRAWREQLIAFHPDRQDPAAFLLGPASPHTVVDMLELLHREGQLTRQAATALQNAILAQTSATGD